MPAAIRFWFDFISPYAYLGWTQVSALAARHGRALEPVPILFAALLNHHGQKGPAEIPAKRVYVFKDVLRTAHALGVPLEPPPTHPFNPLLALRLVSMVEDAAARAAVIDTLFAEAWGTGRGVEDPNRVEAALAARGLPGPALLSAARTDEAKRRLRQATDDAIASGVFGVPTLWIDGEIFWGYDAFPHAERRLEGHDPIDRLDWQRFGSMRASATRNR